MSGECWTLTGGHMGSAAECSGLFDIYGGIVWPLRRLLFHTPPTPGALPGTAEQDAGDQVGAAAGTEVIQEQPASPHLRSPDCWAAAAAGGTAAGWGPPGGGTAEHAGCGGRFQE